MLVVWERHNYDAKHVIACMVGNNIVSGGKE